MRRACLKIQSGPAAVGFGGGQGGEACASPQRADCLRAAHVNSRQLIGRGLGSQMAEPTRANAKRRAEGPLSIFRQALNTVNRVPAETDYPEIRNKNDRDASRFWSRNTLKKVPPYPQRSGGGFFNAFMPKRLMQTGRLYFGFRDSPGWGLGKTGNEDLPSKLPGLVGFRGTGRLVDNMPISRPLYASSAMRRCLSARSAGSNVSWRPSQRSYLVVAA